MLSWLPFTPFLCLSIIFTFGGAPHCPPRPYRFVILIIHDLLKSKPSKLINYEDGLFFYHKGILWSNSTSLLRAYHSPSVYNITFVDFSAPTSEVICVPSYSIPRWWKPHSLTSARPSFETRPCHLPAMCLCKLLILSKTQMKHFAMI